MIHANRIVTVGEQESIIDRPIILYRGDREVEIEFTLVGNEFTFSEEGNVIKSVNASHGQLVLNTPSGEHMFSELAECHEGKVVFVVTKEMIDELIEVGFYNFQIRLYDGVEMKSRVTIPPVLQGFDIRSPIASEDETNVADLGVVDYSRVGKDEWEEELPTFDYQGNYNKTDWQHHDVIYTNKLNKIEDALYSINANIKESDVIMLNALDNVKKDADKYVKEHMAEVEQDVDEFERNLNTDVQQFKIDTNAAITAHKNEVSEVVDEFSGELESVNSQLAHNTNYVNIFKTEKVNVFDFGAKGDGVTDDTQAIKDAIAYAQSHPSKTIFLPKTSNSYLITDTINFYRMNVECPATIKVGFNGIGIIAGSSSSIAENYIMYINCVTHTNYVEGDISVRVQGSKRMKFTLGTMQKLQIYADGNNTINSSVAYCQFDLIGNISILEILGENRMGWINENTFYKGRIQNVIIDGAYSHNKNLFFDSCIEGGNITINRGHCNKFINIRNENIQSTYFAPSTHHNIVELSYYSSASNAVDKGTVTDYGISNRVIEPEDYFASVEFLNMDAYNCKLLEESHTGITIDGNTFALESWKYVTTVYIPYRYAKRIYVHTDTDNGTRINVAVLDSNKNVVPTQYILCMGTNWDATQSCLISSINTKASYQIVGNGIKDGVDLAYIRVKIYTGNQKVTFNRINITVRCNPADIPYINMAKPRINYNKLQ